MTIADDSIETTIIVGMVCERHVFDACHDLGLPDFSDYRCRAVLQAIRSLPNHHAEISWDAIVDTIGMRDLERGTVVRQHVEWWLLGAMLDPDTYPPYRDAPLKLDAHIAWLRELANRREQIARAS